MPSHPQALDAVEYVLIAVGVAIWLIGAVRSRGRWRSFLHFAPFPQHRFSALDAVVAYFLLVSIGTLAASAWMTATAPTSAPASAPSSAPATLDPAVSAAANVVAAAVASAFMIAVARGRVAGGLPAWGLTRLPVAPTAARVTLAYLAVWPACAGLLLAGKWLIPRLAPGYEVHDHPTLELLRHASGGALPLLVISAVLAAPISEELLFRGLILNLLHRATGSAWWAIALSGLLFGLVHAPQWETVAPLAFFGVVLGYTYARTRSLTFAVLLHALFNARTIASALLQG
ncbi:MAG: CPBP family intramembrane glutamic endopeptidase [Phycisphaerae bacterium]